MGPASTPPESASVAPASVVVPLEPPELLLELDEEPLAPLDDEAAASLGPEVAVPPHAANAPTSIMRRIMRRA